MPTKIINILQDDNFENILRIFQETPANEVIFVLPRKHQALSNDDHFYILSEAASEQGKNVMILTSNSDVSDLALKYNIGVLTSAKANPRVLSQKVKKEAREIAIKNAKLYKEQEDITLGSIKSLAAILATRTHGIYKPKDSFIKIIL